MAASRRRVVVATRNKGKLAEIRGALAPLGWEFVAGEDLGSVPDVRETGATFFDNAKLKAEAYRRHFGGMAALADDSGLEVDALDGRPGVRSARFAGEQASDADNNAKLLRALGDLPLEKRTARFRSTIVFVDEGGASITASGVCEGRIGFEPRGTGGFGYDPLFLPDATPGRTMAELSLQQKNTISHRGDALRAFLERLRGGRR
ncbi:MAG TPA: RdgB/HAM1 family non-canonical purine NTP pyrophosphatase [Coriobacteriia bacterium]|jgi:XTP/dITP diphosphohydrolase